MNPHETADEQRTRTAAPSEVGSPPQVDDDAGRAALLEGIDRAALVLAVLAGAIGVMSSDGDWGAINTFEGLLLLAIVLGFHRPMPTDPTPRVYLMRAAFGLAVSFSLCITVGWPVVQVGGDVYRPGWMAGFALLGVFLAVLEPAVARALDHRLRWSSTDGTR